jgi:FdhE protein
VIAGDALSIAALERRHPEWAGWLRLLGIAREAAADPAWQTLAPTAAPPDDLPRLTGAEIAVDVRATARLVRDLFRHAGDGAGWTLERLADLGDDTALAVLEAAVNEDAARLDALAQRHGGDPGALAGVAPLIATPVLQASARRLAAQVPAAWTAGACPVCGAWPSLVEERGLERSRRLRCGRCGSDWHGEWLCCPFCGLRDHRRLGGLVPDEPLPTRRIETCEGCRGYVKVLTLLTATPPLDVALADLASVDLDLLALDRGLRRPAGPGRALGARMTARPGRARRLLAWSRWPRAGRAA